MKASQTLILLGVVCTMIGCASTGSTYFRKHGNSLEQERIDWGLCGGNFFENGALRPIVDTAVLDCMAEKGYRTINEYYKENMIAWTSLDSPEDVFWNHSDLKLCGARSTKKGVCQHSLFVLKRELRSISACMRRKGFSLAIPRYKIGVRIFDDLSQVDKNYCTYLTPVEPKGTVSLGSWRLDL